MTNEKLQIYIITSKQSRQQRCYEVQTTSSAYWVFKLIIENYYQFWCFWILTFVFYTFCLEKCGGSLTSPIGKFTASGKMSQPCIWVIDTNSMENLSLNFKTLKITNIDGICNNYLEIRAGKSYDSPLVEKICHSNHSQTIKTKSPTLFIRFFSNDNLSIIDGLYDAGILF